MQCMKSFKRGKFKAHKCEKVLSEQEVKLLKEAMAISKQDKGSEVSPLLNGRKGSIMDEPRDKAEYVAFWKKKTSKKYCLGVGRWFKICKQNLKKDEEHKAKLF